MGVCEGTKGTLLCKCVRVYWEEVYGGLGFEVVVLKWVVLCLMVLTHMVLCWVVLDESGFDGNGFVRVVLELIILGLMVL